MKKYIFTLIVFVLYSLTLNSQNIYIPDQAFKARLISLGIDLNNDGEISYEEASVVDQLDISFMGWEPIADITGIEAFITLDTLICTWNTITIFDSLNNLPLKFLDCSGNPNDSLQLSLLELTFLKCIDNNISYLDVSFYPDLYTLICSPSDSLKINNQFLTKLIVESFIPINTLSAPELKTLICHSDPAPDLSNNSQLVYLENRSQFSSIDISSNLLLEHVFLWGGNLTTIDLSNNLALTYVNLMQNELFSLDVSNNLDLDTLICRINNIPNLDLSNNLNLLYVDCESNQITDLDLANLSNLKWLNCGNNQLTDIYLNENIGLIRLEVFRNQLSSIDITENTGLEYFSCVENNFTGTLNLSQNINLKYLNCSENGLVSLDLSNNTMLTVLWCHRNNLTDLNVNGLVNLLGLHCFENNLNQLDLYTNVSITDMQCSYNPIDSLDLSNNDSWVLVSLAYMPSLTKVCVSELPVQYTINTTGSPNVIIEACSFVGIHEEFDKSLNIYPNPTKGMLNIVYNDLTRLSVSIYNIHGEVLKENIINKQSLNLSNLPNGVYFIKFKVGNEFFVRKILKN